MSAYLQGLRVSVEIDAQARQAAEKSRDAAARDRLTPLEDRLSRLLATIPSDVQHEGLSLPALQAALRGRWRGHCHPGELGAALRKLGFTRVRRWSGDAAFSAVWRRV